jgi:HAD superfamily hydrolase (TIGR01509 family)
VTEVINAWLASDQPAVVFDFNGTLSDDEHILFDIFSDLFSRHLGWAMTAAEYRDQLLGRSDREIVERALQLHGRAGDDTVDELLSLRKAAYKNRVAEEHPIDRTTVEFVNILTGNGFPVAIVTGAQRDDVLAVLQSSPVGDAFGVLVAEEDVTMGKPDPEGFLTAARLLGRRPGDVLVFEDSVPGVRGALAAGMHCIAVGGSDPSAELLAVAPAVVARLSPEMWEGAPLKTPGTSPRGSTDPQPST